LAKALACLEKHASAKPGMASGATL